MESAGQGTRVEVFLGDALPVDEDTFTWPRRAVLLAKGDGYKGKTSPWWYDADSFYELTQAAGKVIPPVSVLKRQLVDTTRSLVKKVLIDEAIRAARVDEQTEAAMSRLRPKVGRFGGRLAKDRRGWRRG